MTCHGDGLCDVYYPSRDNQGCMVEVRCAATEWCKCTKEMCITECPNKVLCGVGEIPKVLLLHGNGMCRNCDDVFGVKLEFVKTDVAEDCSICMNEALLFVAWPCCPGL
jgi:hypothetical protein